MRRFLAMTPVIFAIVMLFVTLRYCGVIPEFGPDSGEVTPSPQHAVTMEPRTPTPQATSLPDATPSPPVPSWSGSGPTQTESFTVRSREWRIHWETVNDQGSGFLQISIHDGAGRFVRAVVNHAGVGRGLAQVSLTPDQYNLTINSANLDWNIWVEQGQQPVGTWSSPGT